MLSSGNNSGRGNTILPSLDVPPLPQYLPLEPITLGNQKYTRLGELRRVLGVPGSNSVEHSFGVGHLKPPPPVATEELKNFKDSVQDGSRKARDRAKKLRESISKLDKYKEALGSKKRQCSDLLSNERSGGANLLKMGSHSLQNPQKTQRLIEKSKTVGLGPKKRVRSSLLERVDGRFSAISGQHIALEKDKDVLKASSKGAIHVEEKMQRLPAGGEGWDKKMKRKRSVGAVGSRAMNVDRDIKRAMHMKPNADTKMRSFDGHGFRLGSQEGNLAPGTVRKTKVSRAPRTGSSMTTDSSPDVHPSCGTPEEWEQPRSGSKVQPFDVANSHKRPMSTGSSSHPMAQWVGQRPHKISRTRRVNVVSPVSNNEEAQILSQGFRPSDLTARVSSHGNNEPVLASCISNNSAKLTVKFENGSSLVGLSINKELGAGQNKLREKGADTSQLAVNADQTGGFLRKDKVLVKEETGKGENQGKTGRLLSSTRPIINPVTEKLENFPRSKPLQSIRHGSDKNKSKSSRPPSKKVMDRKTSRQVLNTGSADLTGESDDDREQLLVAAKSACNASYLACSSPFWKKMEHLFTCIGSQDAFYLKQQLSLAEELNESLSQMFGECHTMGVLMHKEASLSSGKRQGSHSEQESVKCDAVCGGFEMERRLDKVPPLYQRVLSALIEEDETEELYHQNEGKNMSFQCASDDSHCGSCNHIDVDPKDRDRMDSEVESEVVLQTQKHCLLDRFSCNKSPSNTHSSRSISSFLCNNEHWQTDDDMLYSDVELVTRICQSDLGVSNSLEANTSCFSSSDRQYQMLCLDDRLLLELHSIGLYPETMPELSEEGINKEIVELQGGLYQQTGKMKKSLGKINRAIQYGRDVERRDGEHVAMSKLVEMAYKKRMACRGSHSSKSVVRKVSKQVALAFVKRTLARCQKFEDTGISCFSDADLQDVIFCATSCGHDANSADFVGSGTASKRNNDACSHKAEARGSGATTGILERHESLSDDLGRGTSDAMLSIAHSSGKPFFKHEASNKGKKREVLLGDVVSKASLKPTSVTGSTHLGRVKGKRAERDGAQNREIFTSNSASGFGCQSLGSLRSERRSKAKPKQKTNLLSNPINGLPGRSMESTHYGSPSVDGVIKKLSRETGQDSSEMKEKSNEFANLQLGELDPMEIGVSNQFDEHQDLSSFLNFDDDGLQDHDSMGLAIPMDDLSELQMLM